MVRTPSFLVPNWLGERFIEILGVREEEIQESTILIKELAKPIPLVFMLLYEVASRGFLIRTRRELEQSKSLISSLKPLSLMVLRKRTKASEYSFVNSSSYFELRHCLMIIG